MVDQTLLSFRTDSYQNNTFLNKKAGLHLSFSVTSSKKCRKKNLNHLHYCLPDNGSLPSKLKAGLSAKVASTMQ